MSGHRRQGRTPSSAFYTIPELKRYVAMAEAGQRTLTATAAELGISTTALCNAIKRAGLRVRRTDDVVLDHLGRVGPASAVGLMEAFPGWSHTRATRALRRLQRDGLVQRCGHFKTPGTIGPGRKLYRVSQAGWKRLG